MSAPTLLAVTASQTHVDVQFNQTVVAPTGQPGAGFSITDNGVALTITSAALIAADTVRLVVAKIDEGDSVLVTLVNTGTLTNSGAENAANFTNTAATNTSTQPAPFAAASALHGHPEVISLLFSSKVNPVGGLVGLTVQVNGVTVVPASIANGADPRELAITMPAGLQYRDTFTAAYVGTTGAWVKASDSTPMASFTLSGVNGSTVGIPNAAYPLSNVIRNKLAPVNGIVVATVSCDINLVDQGLIDSYGPAVVDFGNGTFGVTMANPDGVTLSQDLRQIGNGLSVSKNFFVLNHPAWTADAAADWLNVITQRIATALGALRTTDGTVDLGSRTIEQV